MFKRFLTSLLIGAALHAHGMGTKLPAFLTNATPVSATTNISVVTNDVAAPVVQGDTLVASGSFVRPALAVGDDGVIYVAAEGPKMGSISQWSSADGKKWTAGKGVVGTVQTALRTYVVDCLPGIVSFRYGKKEAGKFHGPGTIRNGKETFEAFSTGAARLAMSKDGPILLSKNGIWKNLNTGKVGNYNAGSTGEKFAFAIDPESGMWATCHNGYSKEPSAVSINGKRQTWADYNTYPDQGSDLNYPSICIVSGNVWCASVYSGQLRVQMVGKSGLRWPTTALPTLGKANVQDRCPPRLIALQGRLWAYWTYGGNIMRVDVEKRLAGKAEPSIVCKGMFPALAGPYMVYVAGGGLYIKTIQEG